MYVFPCYGPPTTIITTSTGSEGPPGPPGPPGSQGQQGISIIDANIEDYDLILYFSDGTQTNLGNIRGPQGANGECLSIYPTKLIKNDYSATEKDLYIGVISDKPVKIILPEMPLDGKFLIIKLEMGPPIGNRKVTVTTTDDSTIDNKINYILQNPYETITLLFRGENWHLI